MVPNTNCHCPYSTETQVDFCAYEPGTEHFMNCTKDCGDASCALRQAHSDAIVAAVIAAGSQG